MPTHCAHSAGDTRAPAAARLKAAPAAASASSAPNAASESARGPGSAGVHAAPGVVAAGLGAGTPRPHPFLRYDASLLNARAFLEGAVLTRRRARERFEEGLRDGEELLRRHAEDALFVA